MVHFLGPQGPNEMAVAFFGKKKKKKSAHRQSGFSFLFCAARWKQRRTLVAVIIPDVFFLLDLADVADAKKKTRVLFRKRYISCASGYVKYPRTHFM